MAGYLSVKMKRKDLEEVYDEFSDFSLSSPARKIRRLDAELPPIMEEGDFEIPQVCQQPLPEENLTNSMEQMEAPVTEAVPSLSLNEERALILYKPVNPPLLDSSSSSNISLTVNPEWVPGFKKQFFWSGNSNPLKTMKHEEHHQLGKNDCLAVVPWVPSQLPTASEVDVSTTEAAEPMEAEEVDVTMMETEEDNSNGGEGQVRENGSMGEGDGLQQWQQQHCMIPQFPQNASAPIMWFR